MCEGTAIQECDKGESICMQWYDLIDCHVYTTLLVLFIFIHQSRLLIPPTEVVLAVSEAYAQSNTMSLLQQLPADLPNEMHFEQF